MISYFANTVCNVHKVLIKLFCHLFFVCKNSVILLENDIICLFRSF